MNTTEVSWGINTKWYSLRANYPTSLGITYKTNKKPIWMCLNRQSMHKIHIHYFSSKYFYLLLERSKNSCIEYKYILHSITNFYIFLVSYIQRITITSICGTHVGVNQQLKDILYIYIHYNIYTSIYVYFCT